LRPDIPQKSGTVPSNDDRSPLVDNRPSVTSEVSRPSCNAAAILGIALSIGTGSFIAPGFQAVAQANEPVSQVSAQSPVVVQEPLLTAVPQLQVAVVPQTEPQVVERSLTSPVAPAVATSVAPAPAADVMTLNAGHAVKPGETLWQIAQSYKVEIRALADANRLSTASVLKVGQILQLPAQLPTAIGATPDDHTVNLQAMAQSVPAVPVIGSAGELESAVQARQTAAVSDLRVKRDRLKQSLAELGEESKSASVEFTEGRSNAFAAATQPATSGLPVTRLANVPLPSIGGEAPQMIARRAVDAKVDAKVDVAVPVVPKSDAKSDFNPTPLLAEIHNLRNRANRQKLVTTPTLVAQVVPTESPSTRVEPLQAQSVAVNPDFANRKSDSALSIELRNFVQPKLKPEAADKVKSAPTANAQVMARATLGSEAYAPVTPAVRKMVAPNLPTIGKAEAYLPGGGSSSGMVWPAQGMLSSGFGWRWGRPHKGIDIAAPIGTPIVSAAAGKVAFAGWNDGGYGYLVEVEHVDGTMTRYAHNDRILVKVGQEVNQGQQLSEMGSTGHSTGPHLHFEVRPRGGEAVNPMAFLNNQS
jgi:murein DD-endopeptidase MepM/ murein hydrolase activator NlpD